MKRAAIALLVLSTLALDGCAADDPGRPMALCVNSIVREFMLASPDAPDDEFKAVMADAERACEAQQDDDPAAFLDRWDD